MSDLTGAWAVHLEGIRERIAGQRVKSDILPGDAIGSTRRRLRDPQVP